MPLPRTLAELFHVFADAIRHDIRKCVPATVTAVNPVEQTVDVQIAVNNLLFTDLGDFVEEPAVSLSDVPLGCLRGGGFLIWLPVAVGDSVLLVFSDLSTDTWRSGDGTPHKPGFVGVHTSDSPFAFPMFAPDFKILQSPGAEAGSVIIGKDGSAAQIRITGSNIELGGPSGVPLTDFVALASKVDAAMTLIKTHVHTGVLAGGAVTGPSPALAAIAPTGSTLVKSA
jgi:hypothetical protein